MRVVVLGSTGMAGHVVAQYLEERGYIVYRSSRSECNTQTSAAINVTDFAALDRWLDRISPDMVVNCIGLLQKACDERGDLAFLINAYLPHWLEWRYIKSSVKVVHLSTDCVFSGKTGGYREDALKDGNTMYDRSKAIGEVINGKDLTFRMSIIGPDIDPKGTGLFNWFMAQSGTIEGYSKAVWNGVTTVELARAVDAALEQGLTGLYHLVHPDPIDKCSLLEIFKKVFHRDQVSILRVDGLQVDKSLVNTRNDFRFQVKSYADQVADMYDWVRVHKKLYPHYLI